MARVSSSSSSSGRMVERTSSSSSGSGATVSTRETGGVRAAKGGRRRSSLVMTTGSKTRSPSATPLINPYSYLATLSLVVLALAMVNPVHAIPHASSSLSCSVNADCNTKGVGKCVHKPGYGPTCVYSSCKAGYYGASATYADCRECPNGMTSLAGRAFYSSDCFLPCGDDRCYKPEDGYAECTIDAQTAQQECLQTCNQDGYVVLNPSRAYAICVSPNSLAASNRTLVNQNPRDLPSKPAGAVALDSSMQRMLKRAAGKRLKADADLSHGPAAALMEDAGKDFLALVSK